jgi:hypothetical protein
MSVLDRQTHPYDEFASRVPRAEELDCRDPEDLIDVGLALFSASKNGVASRQKRVEPREMAKSVNAPYR